MDIQRHQHPKILRVERLCRRFGGVMAVHEVSFELGSGELVGLIGPNGAGKTTVFNLITGLDRSDSGNVYFGDREITRQPAHKIVRWGIARTFQNIRLLNQLSVLDNVKIAYHNHVRYHFLHAVLRLPKFYADEHAITERAIKFLELFGLAGVMTERADSLCYGERRRLEIARSLATEGTVLLLDEPAAGMNPRETQELMDMIRRINTEFGLSLLLIEHDMKLVMSICQRVIVMDHGKIIASGSPTVIQRDPAVIEAYLGVRRTSPLKRHGILDC